MSTKAGQELHENVLRIDSRSQTWNGITVADVHEYTKGEVQHSLLNDEETGIAMALEEVGGVTEPRLKPGQACQLDHKPNHMTLVPRGMQLWGHATRGLHYSRYALIRFDLGTLEARFEEEFRPNAFARPRMRFTDTRIHSLVRMLIDIPQGEPSSTLLGDCLTSAMFAILSSETGEVPEATKLSQHNLERVIDFMQSELPRQIELRELAALVGMSQWHFARAFKAATNKSPYQWQLEKRTDLVRQLLLQSDAPLDVIATLAGFCDPMHLIRVFKKRTGETPGAWRRARR
ncbi:hypothetical protein GCM10007301_33820 [Azorhizobium oxalatiphilum]|uniref:HTH araC/xylS-type domain-containing protein n=1 Tax=Azorhizobium oxalatiphilum TaxID=980631 RepID=A0A917C415_9HYPH|nr:AraC family transcriptional regulator [Azorhizobium oxalatiphilum]GGF71320.1 hypothetical protein GCM10007301_33820 [Azorhizobium oxalatiphilum]